MQQTNEAHDASGGVYSFIYNQIVCANMHIEFAIEN